jgi:hypothetical protein
MMSSVGFVSLPSDVSAVAGVAGVAGVSPLFCALQEQEEKTVLLPPVNYLYHLKAIWQGNLKV